MSDDNDDIPLDKKLEEADRRIRIEKLKKRLEEISDGQASFHEVEETSSEMTLEFLEQVVQFHESPRTTNAKMLLEQGIVLPPPEDLSDEALHDVLWRVIRGLAEQQTYLYSTDHLSDRELYTELWIEHLNEETMDLRGEMDSGYHLDLVGSGSDEHNRLYLTYYADEEQRRRWQADFPDMDMPDHQDPPYDRDRLLPKREFD